MASTSTTKDVQFYEFTGQTLVYPITCNLYDFQRDIIKTAIFHNTLISLPAGLGKSLLAAVITFNFHRWFTRGKIVVLSQTRSYLTDQISAYNSYTTLSDETFIEIPANATDDECQAACELPILLASPQKFLSCLNKNLYRIQSLILLVVLETSKISKCQEYQEIFSQINVGEFRLLTFIDPIGMNVKIVKQIVEMFNISKLEVKNVDSPEIKKLTFSAEIESIVVDISSHIGSIKDKFFTVFEKYGKKLKDAKIINGNVVTLTRAQVLKSKEKFLKNPPPNLNAAERNDLVNCLIMCAFLCHGIDLLHNWGVRAFYSYLFDSDKDDSLKKLIKDDELLSKQMDLLVEYLKPNGRKIDSTFVRIMHPKFLKLKNTVGLLFSDSEEIIHQLRIVIICPVECVLTDIEKLFCSLPDVMRCQFVKTKAKCLSSDPLYKETIENFQSGVINVLVITNLVDEIMEIKSSVIISLEPLKPLFRLSDPRFQKTAEKCLFIVTKGSEENKFDALLHEKRYEQKPLDVCLIEESVNENSSLFPEGFDPKFECSSVREAKRNFRNSPGQKSILQFFNSKLAASSPATNSSDASKKLKTSNIKLFADESRSIFADDFDSSHQSTANVADESHPIADSFFDDPLPYLPDHFVKTSPVARASSSNIDDSFDDLILDFANDLRDFKLRNSVSTKNTSTSPSLVTSATSPILGRCKTSWAKKKTQKSTTSSLKPAESDCSHISDSVTKSQRVSQSKKSRACDIGLEDLPNVSFVDDLFSDSSNSGTSDHEEPQIKVSLPKTNASTVAFPEESFGDFVFSEDLTLPKNQPKIAPSTAPSVSAPKRIPSSFFTTAKNLNNNDPKKISAEKPGANLERPLFDDEEDDLFEDISWLDSEKSSKADVSKNCATNRQPSRPLVSSSMPTFPPKSKSAAFDSSSDVSRLKTVDESSRSRVPDFSSTEIPSEFLDDFVPASPPRESSGRSVGQSSKVSVLDTSPILFSVKKSNRKLFSSVQRTDGNEKRTPLKFDSLLDAAGENSKLIKKADVDSLEDKENEIKVVPSTPPDYELDSILFDDIDDLFINDITNKESKVEVQDVPSKVLEANKVGDTSHEKAELADSLNTSSTSPSLFDIYNNYSMNKSSYVEATVTIPSRKKLELPTESKSPAPLQNCTSFFDKTSTPIRETPKNKMSNFRKRSTPLFDESDNNFGSPRPQSALRSSLLGKIAQMTSPSAAEKKKRLFSNFAESVKQKLSVSDSNADNVSRVEETKAMQSRSIIDSSDDDIPWLSKTSPLGNSDRLACFKKPVEPSIKSRYFSHRVTPGTPGNLTDSSEVASSPTPPINRRQKKKRSRLKRNLAEQFIDAEAEVTGDDDNGEDDDDCFADDCQLSDDSFIDDNSNAKSENISRYLKFIKSPDVAIGKFRIPVLSEKQMKVNVYSQAPEHDQTYENDSFCVDEDEPEPDDTYVPSVLSQLEERLDKRKAGKNFSKTKQFKRIRIIEDSSPESPDVRQNQHKRIKHFSSDSED